MIFSIEDNGHYYRVIQMKKENLVIQLLLNIDAENSTIMALRKSLVIAFCILLAVALGLAAWLASLVLKPIKLIYKKQVLFVQEASHEIRTPLAVIKGQIELLSRKGGDLVSDHYDTLATLMEEIHGLEKMSSDLLFMTKEDIGVPNEVQVINLKELIEEVSMLYKDIALMQDKQFIIQVEVTERLVEWDIIKIKRCMTILLDNALKYTNDQDQITLAVSQKDGRTIRIRIEDTGIGIQEEELAHILRGFYEVKGVRVPVWVVVG